MPIGNFWWVRWPKVTARWHDARRPNIAAASIGVLLGKVVRTMAQFALLLMLIIMPNMILLGGRKMTRHQ